MSLDIVGWRTSSIRRNSELPKLEDCVDEKYPHVVYEELCKACGAEQRESLKEDDGLDKLEVEVKKQSSCTVHLTNVTEQYVAFKVKTTSPNKYCVRPNVGIMKPKSTCDFVG